MKIDALMTHDVAVCQPDTNLAEVGSKMWKTDCGIVPVVDSSGVTVGVVTDRDICMALTTRNVPASTLKARDVMTEKVHSCRPDDEVLDALHTMRARRIRRLPVVREDGRLMGILSLSDLLRKTGSAGTSPVGTDVLEALNAISEPAQIQHEELVPTK